jgi:2-amino-4-hydroxy-6-hydroxymethyldihydropteridine diphosphokinase
MSAPSARAYLGLGSNLGDRAANLWEAVRRISVLPTCQVLRVSALYETEPVGLADQPWFLNAALKIDTGLEPLELLRVVKEVEREMGRTPSIRWGPRTIDIDILLFDDFEVDSAELTVPHRELWNRRFVLIPLATILEPGPLAERVTARLETLGSAPAVRAYRL